MIGVSAGTVLFTFAIVLLLLPRAPVLFNIHRLVGRRPLRVCTAGPADAAAPHQLPPQERAGDDLLARALRRARWTIFWERLWPALASIATVIGLFLALSWLGLW